MAYVYDFNLVGGRIEDIIDWCTYEYNSTNDEAIKTCLKSAKEHLLRSHICIARARDLVYKKRPQ